MGVYDLALKHVESQPENDGYALLKSGIEAEKRGEIQTAHEKYLSAIDSFRNSLTEKKHDRFSRDGLIDTWMRLAYLYPDVSEFIERQKNEFMYKDEGKDFGFSSFKTAFVDTFLEGDWRKQCDGKYGGEKPHNKSWKGFYFDNESMVDSLDSMTQKISWAVKNGHHSFLLFHLQKEKEIKLNTPPCAHSKETFLEMAIKSGASKVIDILLEYGAKLTIKGTEKWLPIHWAVYKGDKRILRTLLDKGARVNVKDSTSITPLHIAAYKGHDEMVEILLEKGAHVNVVDASGEYSPLHFAVFNNQEDIVTMLLEAGANSKSQDAFGRTLLHWACTMGKETLASLLISYGANVNAKDTLDRTPLHWASQCGNHDLMALLLENKAKLNLEDRYGERPMIIAAFCNHKKEVSLLFENGGR